MNRKHFLLAIAAAVALAAVPAFAKPNFSGNWKLVAEKSDFGPMPPPEKYESKITHTDPEMKVATTQVGQQGEVSTEWTYNTEGKETTNSFMGNSGKSTATWEGDTLVIQTKLEIQGNQITLSSRWSMADEKTLNIVQKINTPQGDLEMKVVLAKQ